MKTSYQVLQDWLKRIGADRLWRYGDKQFDIIGYAVNGEKSRNVFIVTVQYSRQTAHEAQEVRGWNIYVPSTNENKTELCIDEAAIKLGVEGCAGLIA